MELYLDKVGIIEDSNVKIDGLTVVTGINSSGKTTVGRTVYSVISALGNAESDYKHSTRTFIIMRLNDVYSNFGFVEKYGANYGANYPFFRRHRITFDNTILILASRIYTRFDTEELYAYFDELRKCLQDTTLSEFVEALNDSEDYPGFRSEFVYESTSEEVFYQIKQESLKILNDAYHTLSAPDSYHLFIKDNVKDYLNYEFRNQINPVKDRTAVSRIRVSDRNIVIADIKIKSKNDVGFSEDSTLKSYFTKSIFIDNPFVLDDLNDMPYRRSAVGRYDDDERIHNRNIKSHDRKLYDLIRFQTDNFFENIEMNHRLKLVFERINSIVPGEFLQDKEGYFYVDDGARLSLNNLATGSKMFFIIKQLLMNGSIDEKTVLVLDEPESHLHPEWINKFAEILVLLIGELKVRILLTTHSPNLMLALNYYAKKSNLAEDAHFYLADRGDYYSKIKCIDGNIGEGYSHLSLPLIQMNLMMNALDEGSNE